MNDDGRRIAHFMRFLGFGSPRRRMVERNDFGRLLPDCCPNGTLRTGRSTVGLIVASASAL
jgi:hypothetical protein